MKPITSLFFENSEIDFAFSCKPEYERFAVRVRDSKDRQADALYQIALTVTEAKNQLRHGTFLAFLRDPRVNINARMAEHLMRMARAEDGRELAKLGIAKAVQMLRLDLDQRRKLFAQHRLEQLSVSKLRGLINDLLGHRTGKRPGRAALKSETEMVWAAGVLHLELPISRITAVSIDTAFRALAQLLHPDKGLTSDGAFFRTLVKAREILGGALGELMKAA